MRRYLRVAPLAVGLLAAGTASAVAQQSHPCFNEQAAPDARVAACSKAISSGKYHGEELARLFHFRARAHEAKEDYHGALGDMNEVLRLSPSAERAVLAERQLDRGWLHHNLGQYQAAILDYDEAIKLNAAGAKAFYGRAKSYLERTCATRASPIPRHALARGER